MNEILQRFWDEIVARPDGPLALRFYLQPVMASLFAVRDGLRDSREGRPAYLWSLFTHPAHRGWLIRDGWKSVGKIFMLAVALDVVYQAVVLRGFRPIETIVIATILALVPYAILRGPVNRIATRRRGGRPSSRAA